MVNSSQIVYDELPFGGFGESGLGKEHGIEALDHYQEAKAVVVKQSPRVTPLYFEDVEVGFRFETPSRTVTEADLVAFAGVSGDFNPLHTDAVFAARTIYGERIAHGALVLSLATGLRQRAGVFDGTLMGLLEIRTWRFIAPVRIGDTIRVVNEVTEFARRRSRIEESWCSGSRS